jgi:hypothetical protein
MGRDLLVPTGIVFTIGGLGADLPLLGVLPGWLGALGPFVVALGIAVGVRGLARPFGSTALGAGLTALLGFVVIAVVDNVTGGINLGAAILSVTFCSLCAMLAAVATIAGLVAQGETRTTADTDAR